MEPYMSRGLNKIGLAVALVFVANSAFAVETSVESSIEWKAEIIKKTVAELNVSATNEKLQFEWDPKARVFNKPKSALTIEATGLTGTTAYSIKAQLKQFKIAHALGVDKGSVDISADVGGIAVTGDASVSILEGSDKGVDLSAEGMAGMDLSKIGPNATEVGNLHRSDAVTVTFDIAKGKRDGIDLVLGGGENGLDQLLDGEYQGTVEMTFVASWTAA
jgi:hypothetical protein